MIECFELLIDKSDVIDLACAIECGDRAKAADALNRLLATEISEDNNAGLRLTEWIAQGRALAAKQVAA